MMKLFFSASGSNATTAVENCVRNPLCDSCRDVPRSATPTKDVEPKPTTAALTQSSTTIATVPEPHVYGKPLFPYLRHFGKRLVRDRPVASTMAPSCRMGNTTLSSLTSYSK